MNADLLRVLSHLKKVHIIVPMFFSVDLFMSIIFGDASGNKHLHACESIFTKGHVCNVLILQQFFRENFRE